jgi:hypothetical protein
VAPRWRFSAGRARAEVGDVRLALVAIVIAGCGKLEPRNGAVRCSPSGKACPDGYHCEPMSVTCWRNGQSPDFGSASDGGNDLGELRPKSAPCTKDGAPCASGWCVDGVCCESDCSGSCQACNLAGQEGNCLNAPPGQPRGDRAPCAGMGTCAGSCTGASAACVYPATSVVCGAACDGKCDGVGACSSTAGGACPNGFACGASACKTTCSDSATDCQPNFTCAKGACTRVPESDCLDGKDNNGDGLADCADPTCTTVTCVHDVPLGDEIGLFADVGTPCPAGYAAATTEYQGFGAEPCSCACTPYVSCSVLIENFANSDRSCGGTVQTSATLSYTIPGPQACAATNGAAFKPGSIRVNVPGYINTGCRDVGNAARPSPGFTTTKKFCGASATSATCPSGQVCAPKLAASMCARAPGGGGCPAGYATSQGGAPWYTSYTDDRVCTCANCATTGNGSCPSSFAETVYPNADNSACGSFDGVLTESNLQAPFCVDWVGSWNSLVGGFGNQSGGFTTNAGGTCSRMANLTSGAATPQGASTICCQ